LRGTAGGSFQSKPTFAAPQFDGAGQGTERHWHAGERTCIRAGVERDRQGTQPARQGFACVTSDKAHATVTKIVFMIGPDYMGLVSACLSLSNLRIF
jgi:hypothetical protein